MLKRRDIARTRKLCLKKLGSHAKRRFDVCVQAPDNWDGYLAKPLNEASLLSLQTFLTSFPSVRHFKGVVATFFLDTQGNLELLWTQGAAVVENYGVMELTFREGVVEVSMMDDQEQYTTFPSDQTRQTFDTLNLLVSKLT